MDHDVDAVVNDRRWDQHVNRMIEYLQAHCPTMGYVPQQLYRWDEEAQPLPVRRGPVELRGEYVLCSPTLELHGTKTCPWRGRTSSRGKWMRRDAAARCLLHLQEHQIHPHDPRQRPLAVHLSGHGSGGGGGGGGGMVGPAAELPDLSGLLAVQAAIMDPVPAGTGQEDGSESESDGDVEHAAPLGVRPDQGAAAGHEHEHVARTSLPPSNLGRLGESSTHDSGSTSSRGWRQAASSG